MIRSTFIAGFPGETEEEFEHLLQFMREARIDRAGCFAYSPVEGAAANDIPGMLPQALREERRERFMAVAEAVSSAKLRERIGADMQVLVDSAPALGRKGGVGRSYADAPEIDGTVKLLPPEKLSKRLAVGEFTRARVVGHRWPRPRRGADLNTRSARTDLTASPDSPQGLSFLGSTNNKAGMAGFMIHGAQEGTRTPTMLLAST